MTPELVRGLDTFLARYVFQNPQSHHVCLSMETFSCQTYEGGFSAASQPYFRASDDESVPKIESLLPYPRPPLGEAHGGYTFCALGALALLEPLKTSSVPHQSLKSTTRWMGVDIKRLYRWAASLQGLEIEGGGFRGRTNKLVDGCYSWWVGGLFPLLDDIMGEPLTLKDVATRETTCCAASNEKPDEWADDDGVCSCSCCFPTVLPFGHLRIPLFLQISGESV